MERAIKAICMGLMGGGSKEKEHVDKAVCTARTLQRPLLRSMEEWNGVAHLLKGAIRLTILLEEKSVPDSEELPRMGSAKLRELRPMDES